MQRITAFLSASLLALLVSGIVGITASATAQSPGSFARTSDMTDGSITALRNTAVQWPRAPCRRIGRARHS